MRIVLVGAGRWAQTLYRVVKADFPDVQVVAVCRERDERPAWLDESVEVTKAEYLTLRSDPIDAVLVATGPDVSVPIVSQLLRAGIPCYVEKPFTTASVPFGPEFDGRVPFLVGHQHVFGLDVEEAEAEVRFEQDAIDTIHVRSYGPGPDRSYDPIFDYGSHAMAVVFYVLGRQLQLVGVVDDMAVWRTADGVRVFVEAGNARPEKRFDVVFRFRSGEIFTYDGRNTEARPLQRSLRAFFDAVRAYRDDGSVPADRRFGIGISEAVDHACQAWLLRRRLEHVAALQAGWTPYGFGIVEETDSGQTWFTALSITHLPSEVDGAEILDLEVQPFRMK